MKKGVITKEGNPHDIVNLYLNRIMSKEKTEENFESIETDNRFGNKEIEIVDVKYVILIMKIPMFIIQMKG